MSKYIKSILWITGALLGLVIVAAAGLVLFLMATEFSPPVHVTPDIKGSGTRLDPSKRDFSIMTWNIGYAGMGKEVDFFYDGGKTVIPAKTLSDLYLDGIKKTIKEHDSVDFFFLQEIDQSAKRSWDVDQVSLIDKDLTGFSGIFAINYDVRFVPMPVTKPMGHVVAGLATYARFVPQSADIQYYDACFPWPTRLAFLKRCYALIRFKLDNGKELVLINTHNSAFDSSGALRKRELFILDSVMKREYARGNYVVAGGDWNSNPRGFNPATVADGDLVVPIEPPIENSFLADWHFAFDSLKPSNRFADIPYQKGKTRTTIIDFFVVSPNISVNRIETIRTGFDYSDHEPVVMHFSLSRN